jgi:uncharacterized protein YkwD
MKKLFVAVMILLSFSFISCAELRTPPPVHERFEPAPNNIEEEILVLINKYRHSKGLTSLKMNDVILDVARKHSSDMADSKVAFGHDGFNNRIKSLNEKLYKMQAAGENVASGQTSAEEVVDGWIKSPHHKANIEGNFTETGIGVVANKKGVLYYTQIFVR